MQSQDKTLRSILAFFRSRWNWVSVTIALTLVFIFQNCAGYSGLQTLASDAGKSPQPTAIPTEPGFHLRIENFDQDNVTFQGQDTSIDRTQCVKVQNNFRYQPNTNFAGGASGEIGGIMHRSEQQTYYAYSLSRPYGFQQAFQASGKLFLRSLDNSSAFIGWMNRGTSKYWRPPNILGFRLNWESDPNGVRKARFYLEYTTKKGRSGGVRSSINIPLNTSVDWKLEYSPNASGEVKLEVAGQTATLNLETGHKEDDIILQDFGVVNQTVGMGAAEIYLDDIALPNINFDFSTPPSWNDLQESLLHRH